ncbi:hypothetical protein U8527_14730 [Kordia algicida OT-1]|uniref:DUF5104 domain-containing protein n=1 Tax=Kordia algicida OT-1 TaxID=391587 RepID=A9DYQ1_9FLAO|nr:hypothetical protein [Kordia algicida]EDP96163.1 hypothetical protein KAOT1_08338 [Kordia algicida OT-1]
MKKAHHIFTLLIVSVLFISCENSTTIKKPEDVGKHAMTILKKMDKLSKEEYIKALFTLEDVKAFGKENADKISERGLKEIEDLTPEKYNANMERTFNKLKESADKYGIVWKDITYEDYTFEEREQDNIKGTRGTLSFKHDDKPYTIRLSALIMKDKSYKLIGMSGFREN